MDALLSFKNRVGVDVSEFYAHATEEANSVIAL